jgi:hypothetical protein
LLKPVAGARGHFVYTCGQEMKSHFQRMVSVAQSNSSIQNPQAAVSFENKHVTALQ